MPIWAHKVLVVPFLPAGFCVWMVILGLLLRRRWLIWTGVAVLGLSSVTVVGDALLIGLEDSYPVMHVEDCPHADAVVVLGGSLRSESPAGAPEWNEASDRFQRGIDLVRAGKAPVVVFTAARFPGRPEVTEGSLLRAEALRRGLTLEQTTVTDDMVENTAGEAWAVKRLMERRGWKRVILVTSAFHMRRAMRLMRNANAACLPFPSDYLARRQAPLEAMDFLPQADGLLKTERALREWWGILFYKVRGM